MGIYSPQNAEDKNTILSALWIFDAKNAPTETDILAGKVNKQALAIVDAHKAWQSNSLKLLFEEKQLAPGDEFRALLTFHRGKPASAETTESRADHEQKRAISYWKEIDLPYDRIIVPDQAVQQLLDFYFQTRFQFSRHLKSLWDNVTVKPVEVC